MSSFFSVPGSHANKRKRTASGSAPDSSKKSRNYSADKPQRSRKRNEDDEISSDSENEGPRRPVDSEEEGSEDELAGETAQERRLRLAQQYLDNIREEVDDGGFDAEEIDRDLIAERLQGDVAESKGRMYRHISDQYSLSTSISTLFRANQSPTTGIAICLPYLYTVTRDRYLNKYQLPDYPPKSTGSNVTTSKKPCRIKFARGSTKHDTNFSGHIDNILCVAASSDGKFVATGGRDNRLVIWSAADLTVLKVFHQHRAAVTGLVFRRGTNQLYSSSADRTVKLWSLDELAYIDTLFGHQDEILAISALSAERCVTVGARDRTARLWKIVDETQLVFRGSQPGDKPRKFNKDGSLRYEEGSMDCVAMIDEEHFVTGSDNGALALWSLHKKKPLHITPPAHGLADPPKPEQSSAELNPPQEPPCPPQPRAITALVAIPYSDLVFSGSYDGSVRAWKISEDKKMIEPLGAVGKEGGIRGVVNGLSVVERGEEFPKKSKRRNDGVEGAEEVDKGPRQIVIAVGTATEMRLGRWMHVEGRNGGYVLECTRGQFEDKSAEAQDDDEIMEE